MAAAVFWAVPDARREHALLQGQVLCYRQHDYPRAACRYELATLTRGNFPFRVQAGNEWARALGLAGRSREALRRAEEQSRVLPECPQMLRQLAVARFADGDRAGALVSLVEAGRRDPFDRDFRNRFGRLLSAEPETGRQELARQAAARLNLPPGDLALLKSLVAATGGDWIGALALVNGLKPAEATFLPLEFWRGLCLAEAGRPADAVLAFDRHLAIEPLHSDGWYWRAKAILAIGGRAAPEEAIASLRRCVSLNVEDDDARGDLGGLLLRANRPAEVLPVLGPRLSASPKAAEFAIMMAEAHLRLGQKAEARQLIEKMLRRTGDQRLKAALEKLGQFERQPPMDTDELR